MLKGAWVFPHCCALPQPDPRVPTSSHGTLPTPLVLEPASQLVQCRGEGFIQSSATQSKGFYIPPQRGYSMQNGWHGSEQPVCSGVRIRAKCQRTVLSPFQSWPTLSLPPPPSSPSFHPPLPSPIPQASWHFLTLSGQCRTWMWPH